jgi:indole-3-glycerol phosphate synthase
VATYLDTIVASHRVQAAHDTRSLEHLVEAAERQPPIRNFRAALADDDALSVIAEIKRRSPSKGDLALDLDPAALARDYESGGAACLSVLTDTDYFGGSIDDLERARASCTLPVLRKDFTVSALDVCDARLMGADAVLLIVAALSDAELTAFLALARTLLIDALVEVHDEAEVERAVDLGADLIGVNQRDLVTFEVDEQRAAHLAPLMPNGVVRVAESGIRDADDARRLADCGYDALLVGESLVTSGRPAEALAALLRAG